MHDGWRPRTRLAVAATLGAILAILWVSPAAADDPVVTIDDDWLDDGDTTTIRLTDIPAGFGFWTVAVCGNADADGAALPLAESRLPANCHGIDSHGSGWLILPASSTQTPYTLHEPIGTAERTCIPDGEFACEFAFMFVVGGLATSAFVEIVPGPITPTVTGPEVAFDGAVFDFTVDNLGWSGNAAISTCGNADEHGVPLPAIDEQNLAARCSWPFDHTLIAGPGNEIVGAAGTFGGGHSPNVVYSGTIEWEEPIGTLFGPIRCVPGGNFPCAFSFSDAVNGNVFVPIARAQSLPVVTPGSASVLEGDSGTGLIEIPVTLSEAVGWDVTMEWTIFPIEPEGGFGDPTGPGSLSIPAGETEAEVGLFVFGDTKDEYDEQFFVQFHDPVGADIGGFFGLGYGEIIDDDDPPAVIVHFGETGEPAGNMPVLFELSEPSGKTVTVDWATVDSSASAGSDYVDTTGQVTFDPGVESAIRFVPLIDDDVEEPNEIFAVNTSNHVNAVPGGFFGFAFQTIIDDDRDCLSLLGPGADLRFCDLSGETIVGVDLGGADLRGATLDDAALIDVDLTGADLRGGIAPTSFARTQFVRVDLTDADVGGSWMGDATFLGSTLADVRARSALLPRAVLVNTDLGGADLTGTVLADATIVGGAMDSAILDDARADNITLLPTSFENTSTVGTQWGTAAVCPDGTLSGDHRDSCWRLEVGYGPIDLPPGKISVLDSLFQATIEPQFQADPAVMSLHAWFGSTGHRSLGSALTDPDLDGVDERTYAFRVDGAPLLVGTWDYCLEFQVGADWVYACAPLEVIDDARPPISPPASPPASGPISGVSGALSGLVPLLSGPVGLMLTASGVGFVFLIGSSRASVSLRGERRDEDDEQ